MRFAAYIVRKVGKLGPTLKGLVKQTGLVKRKTAIQSHKKLHTAVQKRPTLLAKKVQIKPQSPVGVSPLAQPKVGKPGKLAPLPKAPMTAPKPTIVAPKAAAGTPSAITSVS